jgi:hypothetical protein
VVRAWLAARRTLFPTARHGETGEFDFGTHHEPVEIDVTVTDAEGASASTHVSGTCP